MSIQPNVEDVGLGGELGRQEISFKQIDVASQPLLVGRPPHAGAVHQPRMRHFANDTLLDPRLEVGIADQLDLALQHLLSGHIGNLRHIAAQFLEPRYRVNAQPLAARPKHKRPPGFLLGSLKAHLLLADKLGVFGGQLEGPTFHLLHTGQNVVNLRRPVGQEHLGKLPSRGGVVRLTDKLRL